MPDPMEFRLPPDIVDALQKVPRPAAMHLPWVGRSPVQSAVAALDTLPPAAVVRADYEIAWLASLHRYHADGAYRRAGTIPTLVARKLLPRVPELEYLYLFHRDGHLREAALDRIEGAVRSPFFFAVIVLRLNDWAGPVRAAARRCADRCFPATPARTISLAALFLLEQRLRWGRWTAVDTVPLDRVLGRGDVTEDVVLRLVEARQGKVGRVLRWALRGPAFDHHLPALATRAKLPNVRAIALQALIESRVRWPTHQEKRWIEKPMGRYRLDWAYASRPVLSEMSADTALALAARDRSAAVRRVAVVGLLTLGRSFGNFDEVATLLAQDRSQALRERATFALNMSAGSAQQR